MRAHDSRSLRAPIAAGLLTAGAVGAYLAPALAGVSTAEGAPVLPSVRRLLGVADRTAGGRGYALTFDDGPHPQGTPAVLEILAAARVPAVFFLVGEQVRRSPSLVGEILAAGHEIALHCDRHRNLLRLAPMQVRDDLERARETIESKSGRALRLYRPPYGVLNAAALALAHARGWRTMLWSRWGRDWQARATPASVTARVSARAGEGEVLLLHDADDYSAPGSWRTTALALPRVLDGLAAQGLEPAEL